MDIALLVTTTGPVSSAGGTVTVVAVTVVVLEKEPVLVRVVKLVTKINKKKKKNVLGSGGGGHLDGGTAIGHADPDRRLGHEGSSRHSSGAIVGITLGGSGSGSDKAAGDAGGNNDLDEARHDVEETSGVCWAGLGWIGVAEGLRMHRKGGILGVIGLQLYNYCCPLSRCLHYRFQLS